MSKDNIIIGSKLSDGNIIIGTKYGGVIPTTTTTTTSTTTTTTTAGPTTTTTTLLQKAVSMNEFSYNGGDGTTFSCRCSCINGSVPAMSAGECYDLTLRHELYIDPILNGSISYGMVCVSCNASPLYWCRLCASDFPFVTCASFTCTLPQSIDSNDCVIIHAEAYTCNVAYQTCSHSCIVTITPIVGSFCPNNLCNSICTYAGT